MAHRPLTPGRWLYRLQALVLLGGTVLFVWGFGPRRVLTTPATTAMVLGLVLAGGLAVLASLDPRVTVAGQVVDHVTLRGSIMVLLGFVLLGTGTERVLEGDRFGLVGVGVGVLVVGFGVGTVVRSPRLVGEAETEMA